ncbi:MAG: hypothetical protein HFG62_07585 [Lachnospiraceae bacterium]|nr:hypothetical protein [Lachnospiraceae bacterium]MCI8958964.1 hypothetical protein [Lachnospiraceae bacterium]
MSTINSFNAGFGGVSASYTAPKAVEAAAENKTEGKVENTSSQKTPDVDTYEKTQKRLSADQLKAIQKQQMDSMTKMLNGMLNTQAKKAKLASNGISADLFSDLTVTPEQKLAAQQAISENGEWGVNAVATRIVDMCVSLSGGDASKLDEMRAAVEKGFEQAGAQWGTSLPSICNDTHDEINKRFDYWEQNGSMDGYVYGVTGK